MCTVLSFVILNLLTLFPCPGSPSYNDLGVKTLACNNHIIIRSVSLRTWPLSQADAKLLYPGHIALPYGDQCSMVSSLLSFTCMQSINLINQSIIFHRAQPSASRPAPSSWPALWSCTACIQGSRMVLILIWPHIMYKELKTSGTDQIGNQLSLGSFMQQPGDQLVDIFA